MRRTSTMRLLTVALGAVAFGTPAGAIEHALYDCGFNTASQETVTGGQDTYTGVGYGWVTSPTPGEAVSIRCFIQVDGSATASTGTATGTMSAVTVGQLTYTAADTQDVDICAEWTAGSESGTACWEVSTTRVPPQEVADAVGDGYAEGGHNDGETGAQMQVVAGTDGIVAELIGGDAGRRSMGPEAAHDLATSCTFKFVRQTGTLRVIGKTKAGRHPVAESVTVRCRLEDAVTGVVLYDQTRTEPGTLVRLEGTVAANPNSVRVCNAGSGFWDDSDVVATPVVCR